MRGRTILVVALVTCALTPPYTLAGLAQAQGAVPWYGIWKLNVAKSSYAGTPAFKRATCRIEAWEDGVRITYDLVRPRGGITHLEWNGKFDGKDYPVQGVEDYVVTNAYTRIDERTFEIIQKVEGEVAATARMAMSVDGKTITTATISKDGQNTTTVYDRQ